MITFYETVFFLLSEPDPDKFNIVPEKKFTKKVLYEEDNSQDEALAVPH
jgi:hypothetical protein